MDIGFSSVNRMTPPQTAGIGGDVSAPKAIAQEKPALSCTAREVGASELAQVTGEERVDDSALRRDDDLGRLVSKAFDPQTASAALPPLGIDGD